MVEALIAVPSEMPGGLESQVGAHFGHCEVYTIVQVKGGEVSRVGTLQNIPHEHGGCMGPVNLLAQNGVTDLIAGGMGMRPLMGFKQVGIRVYYGGGAQNVGFAVSELLRGNLKPFSTDFTCSGGGCHHD